MTAPTSADRQRTFEIAIVGNDALLAALPARPLQLAHAIHACGYDLVIPASWGEELVAMRALEILESDGDRPRVFCACPMVYSRLMSAGSELAPSLLHLIAPPAAAARYIRAIEPDTRMRITFIGSCPGAADTSIDARVSPADFMAHLERQNISVGQQPLVFESVIPPDRRRHASLPGGAPSPDLLAARGVQFSVIREDSDLAAEIADHLLSPERGLLDLAQAVGCSCAGGVPGGSREAITALEPPRSPLPILDPSVGISLDPVVREVVALEESRASQTPESSTRPPLQYGEQRGVHSIESAARRRAERGRIAVTPPGVRVNHHLRTTHSSRTTREISREAGNGGEVRGGGAGAAAEGAVPGNVPTRDGETQQSQALPGQPALEPSAAISPRTEQPEPDPVRPHQFADREPEPVEPPPSLSRRADEQTKEYPKLETTSDSGSITPLHGSPPSELPASDVSPAPTSSTARRRTPVFGVLHAARSSVHQRKGLRKMIVPRSHGTSTPSAEPSASSAVEEVEQEVVRPIALEPAITPVLLEPRARAFQPELQPSPRRAPRHVNPQGTSKASRLWGLLMSILLIVAITIAVLFILEG